MKYEFTWKFFSKYYLTGYIINGQIRRINYVMTHAYIFQSLFLLELKINLNFVKTWNLKVQA